MGNVIKFDEAMYSKFEKLVERNDSMLAKVKDMIGDSSIVNQSELNAYADVIYSKCCGVMDKLFDAYDKYKTGKTQNTRQKNFAEFIVGLENLEKMMDEVYGKLIGGLREATEQISRFDNRMHISKKGNWIDDNNAQVLARMREKSGITNPTKWNPILHK